MEQANITLEMDQISLIDFHIRSTFVCSGRRFSLQSLPGLHEIVKKKEKCPFLILSLVWLRRKCEKNERYFPTRGKTFHTHFPTTKVRKCESLEWYFHTPLMEAPYIRPTTGCTSCNGCGSQTRIEKDARVWNLQLIWPVYREWHTYLFFKK